MPAASMLRCRRASTPRPRTGCWRARDPETNILRNTIAAFAAGVGGADSIAVLPHTLSQACLTGSPGGWRATRKSSSSARAISTSSRTPSAGSGGIEALTEALCEAAWREFQAIEGEGGIMASLSAGAFQRRVAAVREARETAIRAGSPADRRHDALSRRRGTRRSASLERRRQPRSHGQEARAARWPPFRLDGALEGEDG